jgi:hypothetical protein
METATSQEDKVALAVATHHGALLAQRKTNMFLFGDSMPWRPRMF